MIGEAWLRNTELQVSRVRFQVSGAGFEDLTPDTYLNGTGAKVSKNSPRASHANQRRERGNGR